MDNIEPLNEAELKLKAAFQGSLLKFIQFFYEKRNSRKFVLSLPDSRESHYKTVSRELIKFFNLETNRLMINLPPGHGKSTMLVYWIAWCFTHYPDCQFLYISFSKTLAEKHTAEIKAIMSMVQYQRLFGVKLASDSTAKGRFRTDAGGAVSAFGSAGSITGCFDYDAMVLTETGYLPIGEIVDKKIKKRVLSFDENNKKYEFRYITQWYENPENEIIEVKLSNGGSFECTPDHKILTTNRGWVRADSLLPSDTLKNTTANTYLTRQCAQWNRNIANLFNFIFRKLNNLFTMFRPFPLRILGTNSASPNINNCAAGHFKSRCYFSAFKIGKPKLTNFKNFFFGKFSKCISHCAMAFSVINILRSSTIRQIRRRVVKLISIKMASIFKFMAWSNKCFSNYLMNSNFFSFPISSYGNTVISGSTNPWFQNLSFIKNFLSSFVRMPSIITSNLASIGNTIKSIRSTNLSPLSVVYKRHVFKTYCLEVEKNHNFTIKTIRGSIIVSNCDAGLPNLDRFSGAVVIDDAHKPDEVHSDTMRQNVIDNYNQTIKPRPRSDNVGIIFIGQRLHEEDLGAFLESGADGYEWKKVKLKAIDDSGNVLAPNIKSKEALLIEQERNAYVFASQYQQDPVPAGGGIFKKDWFVKLDNEPEILKTFITVDTAETEKEYNDASVFSFWGIYKPRVHGREVDDLFAIHWLDCWELRIEPKDLVNSFLDFWAECMRYKKKPSLIAIEKKSTGSTLISYLKMSPGMRIHEIPRSRASGSKTDRFLKCQQYVADHLVSLPANSLHTQSCIEHMTKITANNTHRHDDRADTLADAIDLALRQKIITNDLNHHYNKQVTKQIVGAKIHKINELRAKAYYN